MSAAAADKAATVEDLFTKLDSHAKRSEFKQVIKVADEILRIAPKDADALQCKAVALIQSGQPEAALRVLDLAASNDSDLSLERAYCCYRTNQLDAALAALKNAERSPSTLQLEAQILYRMESYSECIARYEELVGRHRIDSMDVKTNLVGAYVAAERSGDVPAVLSKVKVGPRDSFDLAYNVACGLLGRGDLAGAEELLQLSLRVGRETLAEEDFTEEEVEEELAAVQVQLAYVLQERGRAAEAAAAYAAVLKRKPADAVAVAVASSNLAAVRGKRDLFDALKRFDRLIDRKASSGSGLTFSPELEQKLSPRQKEALAVNCCLMLLHGGKLDQARQLVVPLLAAFPESETPVLVQASLLVAEKKGAKAEEMLADHLQHHPSASPSLRLFRAQVAATLGLFANAAASLEKASSLRHQPALVATLVDLKQRAGDVEGAGRVLDDAVGWWDAQMSEDTITTATRERLLQQAGNFKLHHGQHQEAADLFRRLLASGSSGAVRAEAIVGLVASAVHFDPSLAEKYESELPPLAGVTSLDADALLRLASAPSAANRRGKSAAAGEGTSNAAGQGKEAAGTAEAPAKKRKRKRKPRLPKGFDPANPGPPPDPERWLPRRERASYRKRGKKKEINIKGAQGAVARDSGPTAVAPSSKPGPAATAAPLMSQPASESSAKASGGASGSSTASKAKRKGKGRR